MNPGGIMSDVTIPEDVMKRADEVWTELSNWSSLTMTRREAETAIIARAILAERERSSSIAMDVGIRFDEPAIADRIARAIRSSHE